MGFFRKLFSPTQEELSEGWRRQGEKLRQQEEELQRKEEDMRRCPEAWYAAAPCPAHGTTHLKTLLFSVGEGSSFRYANKGEVLTYIRDSYGYDNPSPIFIVCRACCRITGGFVA